MKKNQFTASFAALVVLLNTTVFSQQLCKIVSYNVENYFDCVDDTSTLDEEYLPGGIRGWHYKRYLQKQANIAKVIVAIGAWEPPQLIGLCEVESRKSLIDLTQYSPLKQLGYQFVHHESPDRRGVDVALLYQPIFFTRLADEAISVKYDSHSTTRDILYVKGRIPTGDTIHVFVCHFPSRIGGELESAYKRNAAAARLREKVDAIFHENARAAILIMGDFNDYPDNESLAGILNARHPAEPYKPAALYNLMFPLHTDGNGTHKYEGTWGTLDQFIVSSSLLDNKSALHIDPTDVFVFQPDFLLEEDAKYLGKKPFRTYAGMKYHGGFSDHLPVVANFYYSDF